ncbi:unnamed protein product, partial [Gulo gulo]
VINEVVTTENIINIHKQTQGVGFQKHSPQPFKEIQKFAMMEMSAPVVHTETGLHKAVWAKETRNLPYHICV